MKNIQLTKWSSVKGNVNVVLNVRKSEPDLKLSADLYTSGNSI
jgi:hypothetical protein